MHVLALQVMIVHPVEQLVTGPVPGGDGEVCARAAGDPRDRTAANNPPNTSENACPVTLHLIEVNHVALRGLRLPHILLP